MSDIYVISPIKTGLCVGSDFSALDALLEDERD